MEGWLRKKSPRTQGRHVVDIWQRRYFVLDDGQLRYYKTEKAAHASSADALKSIQLASVFAAENNPRHADMFVIDLGAERKIKLQAESVRVRDAWVAAIEAAKVKAWAEQHQSAYDAVASQPRSRCQTATAVSSAQLQEHRAAEIELQTRCAMTPHSSTASTSAPSPSSRGPQSANGGSVPPMNAVSRARHRDELLPSGSRGGCCLVM